MANVMYVLDPWQEPTLKKKQKLAPRLGSLRGTVVGLLDNYKPNADKVLKAVAKRLEARYGVKDSVYLRKEPNYSGVVTDDERAKLAQCDFVITASGD